jgi:hypothetical protein
VRAKPTIRRSHQCGAFCWIRRAIRFALPLSRRTDAAYGTIQTSPGTGAFVLNEITG